MSNLNQICNEIIIPNKYKKPMWAGAQFFPLKEFAAGLYLSIGPVSADDKQVYVIEFETIKKLASALLLLKYKIEFATESTKTLNHHDCYNHLIESLVEVEEIFK